MPPPAFPYRFRWKDRLRVTTGKRGTDAIPASPRCRCNAAYAYPSAQDRDDTATPLRAITQGWRLHGYRDRPATMSGESLQSRWANLPPPEYDMVPDPDTRSDRADTRARCLSVVPPGW